MFRVAFFLFLLLGLGSVAAQYACEDRFQVEYDSAVQTMERSTRLSRLLAGTDCHRNSRLCSEIAVELGNAMQHVDNAFNRATLLESDGQSCMGCDPRALISLAGETDLGFQVLYDRGFLGRPTQYRRALTDRARRYPECSLLLSYPEMLEGDLPAGPVFDAGRYRIKDSRESSQATGVYCDDVRRRMTLGEQVEPNDCGLVESFPEPGETTPTTVARPGKAPSKPAWGPAGCFRDNARNSGGARAIWTQCAMVPCWGRRLICEDINSDLWESLSVNDNQSKSDDDWHYVLSINAGEPNRLGMYPDNGTVEVIESNGRPKILYGRLSKIK